MVPQIVLPTSGLKVSRVGLGLSRIHHIVMGSDRVRLIEEARGMGVTHFDAARLYGDGIAERALGRAIGTGRDGVTIATKFGLIGNDLVGALGSAARPFWALRRVLRPFGLARWPGRSFSAATMKTSLATSLRLLRTDHVDILHLHEPTAGDVAGNQELIDALADAKRAGRCRHLGLSGSDAAAIGAAYPGTFDVLQLPESESVRAARPPDFTYGILSRAHDRSPPPAGEPAPAGLSASARLSAALARRPAGAILVGTTSAGHLRAAADVAAAASQGTAP